MNLTEEELNSPLWAKLKGHWDKRLLNLRAENDKNLNDIETARLRGKIVEVKANIDLGNPKREIEVE